MNTTRMMAVAMLIAGSGLALHASQAQQAGITRADVLRHDLGAPGREVIQVRVDFAREWRSAGTRIQAQRSSMSSKARWNISSMASLQ